MTVKLQSLGNVIGGARYFGQCPRCGTQHMSTADRVLVRGHSLYCSRCAPIVVQAEVSL